MHIDHQVLVHIAEPGHGAGGDHVEDHLLGAACLHSRGAGDDLRAHVGHDDDLRGGCQWRSLVAGDGGGMCATSAGVCHGGHDVGSAARSGDANHNVLARGAAASDVPLAKFFGIFVDLDGRGQRLGTARHDVLHLSGGGRVGRWTFRGVECRNAAAGASADVNEPAALAQTAGHLVDDLRNLWNRLLDRSCDLRVFMVDDARDIECGFGVKALRSLVLALGSQFLKQSGLVFLIVVSLCAGRLPHRRAGKHRVCPQFLIVSGNWSTSSTIRRQPGPD